MNWDAIGAISEAIGAIGVIVSLLYLASQIRHSTQSSRAATYQSIVSDALRINALVIENEDVARLRRIGSTEPARLTEDELVRYHRLLGVYFRFQDNLYLQRRLGTLDRDQYEGYRAVLENLLSEPGPRQYWQQHSKNYSSLFRAFVADSLGP